jgi:hypothetical protein
MQRAVQGQAPPQTGQPGPSGIPGGPPPPMGAPPPPGMGMSGIMGAPPMGGPPTSFGQSASTFAPQGLRADQQQGGPRTEDTPQPNRMSY